MTIEIEAGASQTQCSMEAASAHAVSKGIWDRVYGEFFAFSPRHPGCTSSFPEEEERNRDTRFLIRIWDCVCEPTLRVEIDTLSLPTNLAFPASSLW